jgi:hypothetical protein
MDHISKVFGLYPVNEAVTLLVVIVFVQEGQW